MESGETDRALMFAGESGTEIEEVWSELLVFIHLAIFLCYAVNSLAPHSLPLPGESSHLHRVVLVLLQVVQDDLQVCGCVLQCLANYNIDMRILVSKHCVGHAFPFSQWSIVNSKSLENTIDMLIIWWCPGEEKTGGGGT